MEVVGVNKALNDYVFSMLNNILKEMADERLQKLNNIVDEFKEKYGIEFDVRYDGYQDKYYAISDQFKITPEVHRLIREIHEHLKSRNYQLLDFSVSGDEVARLMVSEDGFILDVFEWNTIELEKRDGIVVSLIYYKIYNRAV